MTFKFKINFKCTTLAFALFGFLCFAGIFVFSNKTRQISQQINQAMEKFIVCSKNSLTIQTVSTKLSENARLFVMTHDFSMATEYLKEIHEEKLQLIALRELKKIFENDEVTTQRLITAQSQAENLIDIEMYAMKLACTTIKNEDIPKNVREGLHHIQLNQFDIHKAEEEKRYTSIANLFGEGYLIYQKRIRENCAITLESIEKQTQKEYESLISVLRGYQFRLKVIGFLLGLISCLYFFMIFVLIIIPLKKNLKAIKQDKHFELIGASELQNFSIAYNKLYDIKARCEKFLLKDADYDSSTGLLSRNSFDKVCENSQKQRLSIALLLIDIDNFRVVNDKFGYSAGNQFLQDISRILMNTFRQGDYVARIGGDEFGVILQNFKPEGGPTLINKIHKINNQLARLKDSYGNVSISVGIAFSETGYSQSLHLDADKALYKVKTNGKKGCRIFDPEIDNN